MKKSIKVTRNHGGHPLKNVFVANEKKGTAANLVKLQSAIQSINGGSVCIAANTCTDLIRDGICGMLNDRDVRQYVLLSDKNSAARIFGKKYIRILNIAQNGMVLINVINKKARAWLFPDAESDAGLEIDGDDAYRTFCNLFWGKNATSEFRGNGTECAADSPVDQEFAMKDRCSMPGQAGNTLNAFSQEIYLNNPKSDVDVGKFAKTYCADVNGSQDLALSVNGSLDLFGTNDSPKFSLVGNGKTGYVLPKTVTVNSVNWSAPVNESVYVSMANAFHVTWHFEKETVLKNVENKNIRYSDAFSEKKTISPEHETVREYRCGSREEYLSDSSIEEEFVKTLDENRPDAVTVKYAVTALPPKVPAEAEEDDLNTQWKKTSKEWRDSVEALKADCGKYLQTVSALGKGTLSSFENRKNDLCAKADVLISYDIGKMSVPKRELAIGEYRGLCEACEKFRTDCDTEVKKESFENGQKKKISSLKDEIAAGKEKVKSLEEEVSKLNKSKDEKQLGKKQEELTKLKNTVSQKETDLSKESEKKFVYEENSLHGGNRLVPKEFKFPSEELPAFPSALLHSANGARYVSIPESSEESELSNPLLLNDGQRLKAEIVVRD